VILRVLCAFVVNPFLKTPRSLRLRGEKFLALWIQNVKGDFVLDVFMLRWWGFVTIKME
jgi:hypothetical protein